MTLNIRKNITQFLKNRPVIFRAISKVYFALQPVHLMELLIGTKAREREWARRHLYKSSDWRNNQHVGRDDEWVRGYWESQNHSHRKILLDKISKYLPKSILEIGCNCGPNLHLLAKKFPDIEMKGIDINPCAVEKGNELFALECISNITLSVGKADELEQIGDKSFDIVFTDAVLIYIGRDKIQKVIQEMLRIAQKAVILVEWHSFIPQNKKDPLGLGFYHHGCWERDYSTLLRQFIPEKQVSISKITKDVWADEIWSTAGAIIEVIM